MGNNLSSSMVSPVVSANPRSLTNNEAEQQEQAPQVFAGNQVNRNPPIDAVDIDILDPLDQNIVPPPNPNPRTVNAWHYEAGRMVYRSLLDDEESFFIDFKKLSPSDMMHETTKLKVFMDSVQDQLDVISFCNSHIETMEEIRREKKEATQIWEENRNNVVGASLVAISLWIGDEMTVRREGDSHVFFWLGILACLLFVVLCRKVAKRRDPVAENME